MPNAHARRAALLREAADALRSSRRHAGLLARIEAELEDRRRANAGRPSKLAPDEARRLIAEHGTAEAAGRAVGVAGETIRRRAKLVG